MEKAPGALLSGPQSGAAGVDMGFLDAKVRKATWPYPEEL
jgi:hypothetical protein